MQTESGSFEASSSSGQVTGILVKPENPDSLLVLAHGAGAGIHHPWMNTVSAKLAAQGIATFRYQFPYMEQGRKTPGPPAIAMATVRSAVAEAGRLAPGIPLFAGGKSYGGRMTSSAEAKEHLEGLEGIVFFGFPLHAPGRPSNDRAEHLYQVGLPMLFLQGTRDSLADLEYLRPVVSRIGGKASLEIIEGGDHSFRVPKKQNKGEEEVLEGLAASVKKWLLKILA